MKCCVYARFIYDISYLDFFIEHYLKLGFDMIYILFYDFIDYNLPNEWKDVVKIIEVENEGNKLPNRYFNWISQEIDWVLHVDSDEFLFFEKKYRSVQEFIRDKLFQYPKINIFQFSWVWIHKFSALNNNGSLIFQDYKKMIGYNHGQNIIFIKSMIKRKAIESLSCHSCNVKPNIQIHVYSGKKYSYIEEDKPPNFYSKKETCYDEAFLAHVNTRDIFNSIFKSMHIHGNMNTTKRLKDIKLIKNWLENTNLNENNDEQELINRLVKGVGFKILFPLMCLENTLNSTFGNFPIFIYKYPFCSPKYYDIQIQKVKEKLKEIAENQYYLIDLSNFTSKMNYIGLILDKDFIH